MTRKPSDPEPSARFEETKHANDDYKDSRSLTNWTKGFLYAGIAVSVVAFGSNALEYQLLAGMRDGFYPGDAALDASDARQAWVGMLQAAVYLPTMVLVLIWIRRANYNVRQLGARGLRFSPAGSIGWYFVPIVHLWRPYHAMKEIWQASLHPENWLGRPVPVLLPMWWAFWLVSIPLARVDFRLWWSLDENSSVSDLIAANIAAQVAVVWEIPLALLLVAIMNRIYRKQIQHRRPPGATTSGENSTTEARAARGHERNLVGAKWMAIIVALVGMAAYIGVRTVSFFSGRAAVGAAVEFLNSPEEERELRAGFDEESDGWDSWAAIWADSTETMAVWGARVAVFHLTEDELTGLYQYRSAMFGQMAADSVASPLCLGVGAFTGEESLESVSLVDASSIMRLTGRAFGRHHEGRQPWVPPVDLETADAAWMAFFEYLEGTSRGYLLDGLANIGDAIQSDPARDCQVQSELYGLAVERAQDRIGAIRLIDFVRSMDALGVGPLPGMVHVTELDYSADPDFGTVVLQAGFTPNPTVSEIVSFGGVVDTSYLGGDCVGYAARAPDLRLMWSGTSNELRIFFTEDAGEDATLVMNLPDASWVCNDDYAGSLDPLIALENPPEGQYDIWIGSYQPNQFISGTLSVTER